MIEPLWRHRAFGWTLVAAGALLSIGGAWWSAVEFALFEAEFAVIGLFDPSLIDDLGLVFLPVAGFLGGLLASFSPCILPLVPLNLAYIGVNEATGWRALGLSLRFVAGSGAMLSLLGIFGDLAGFLLVEQRGITLTIAGLVAIYFGLVAAEAAPDPLGGHDFPARTSLGPFAAGAAFSLVTTPCSSPFLGAVLAASATHPVPGTALLTMIFFSFGYTLLVFIAGLFGGGLVAWAKRLRLAAPRAVAAALLIVSGVGFVLVGVAWF